MISEQGFPILGWHELPRALSGVLPTGMIRLGPSHFQVEECLGFEPEGEGLHTWLLVRKSGLNTPDVARMIAAHAGVRVRDVGYSGMKDRQAVTTQWFSVPSAGRIEPDWNQLSNEHVCVLRQTRHRRKLRRGSHRSNRFMIRVALPAGDIEQALARFHDVAAHGFPNYFGEQRFGRGGSNLVNAARLLDTGDAARRVRSTSRSMAISAARAWLFNQVLAARVRDGSWNRILPGEAVMLDGSRSFFVAAEPDAELARRLADFDVHPSGPLAGAGASPAVGTAARVEGEALSDFADWSAGLARLGLRHERRALRARPTGCEALAAEDGLRLCFALPRGVFATALLHECIDTVTRPENGMAAESLMNL